MATTGELAPTTTPRAAAGSARIDARARLRQVWLVALIGAVCSTILAISLAELALPLATDQALYSFIGRAIHHGAVPYRDFVDLKPPGIFYVRAALDVLAPVSWTNACFSGPVQASCGWLVVKVADLLTTALFGFGLYVTANVLQLGRGAGVTAACLGALYASQSYVSQMGLTPEKLAALFTLLAVLLAAKRQFVLAGAAAGGAMLMKQPSVTVLVPLCVLAIAGRRWRGLGVVVVAAAVPIAAAGVVLALQGALPTAFDYIVAINFERIATPASLGGFGGDDAVQTAWQAFKNGLAPFWLLGIIGLLAAPGLPRHTRWPLLAWAVTDVVLLLRLREFLQLAPSFALLGGWAAVCVWRAAAQPPHLGLSRPLAARLTLIGILATTVALSSGYQESIVARAINERTTRGFVRSPDEFVADALARVPPGPLYVWGNGTELYLLTDRVPAASSLNVIPLSSNLPGAAARRAQLMRQLSATQPEAIAISPEVSRAGNGIELSGFPPLQTLIDDGYTRLEDVARDSKYGGWQLYVRR